MELKSLDHLVEIAGKKPKKKIAVAAAEDEPALKAVMNAVNENIIEPVLFGKKGEIEKAAEQIEMDLSGVEIHNEKDPVTAANSCVKYIRDGGAQIFMKGHISTADFLRAILNKEYGLRQGALLSHCAFFEIKHYHKLLGLTDAAQNIAPDLDEKIAIAKNAVEIFHKVGVENPKVAALAAIEGVNSKMQTTIEAAALSQMSRRKQIKGCTIDGPLAFDNAISKEAAEHKGIESDVAGDADLLFAPNIEVGNVLYKSLTYFARATVAAVILGASVPVVLTSRSDSDRSKMMSIALAAAT